MGELLRVLFGSGMAYITAKSIYTLMSRDFVERRPVVAASVAGSVLGLAVPSLLMVLASLGWK